ncbi:MAG: phosphoglycerate kinase [Clostridiales bacterium]|nr:phosphoglycerate kinase [Clostridiales bacterium]
MKYNKKSVEDINVTGKKVLIRCDFNVPQDENGNITNDKRIVASLPTIKYLLENKAKVILCSHLGRPKGKIDMKFSLKPVAESLTKHLGFPVKLASDVIGESAMSLASSVKEGEAILLENVRFHEEEEKNDPEFAKKLASLADIYVNDAFGTAHRAHASTAGVAAYIPAVCGFLIQKEITIMGKALENPKRPLVAILGGAKVSDKIGVINNLLEKCDTIIIGGGMAYTFLKAEGLEIGKSLLEEDKTSYALEMINKAKQKGVKMLLPTDVLAADTFAADSPYIIADCTSIPEDKMGLDIGPKTIQSYTNAIHGSGTVIWNGPMGVFEFENFSKGTSAIANAIANENGVISIIGGGDSVAAVKKLGYSDKMTHISTGGGASLEFLEGLELPGIACLLDK